MSEQDKDAIQLAIDALDKARCSQRLGIKSDLLDAIDGVVEAYRALQSQPDILDQKPAHNPWQPIETAPRDGTRVLVWSDELYMKPYIAWWGVDQNAPEDGNEQEEWLTGDGDSWSTGYYYTPCNPTHWQPLPAAPDLNGEG